MVEGGSALAASVERPAEGAVTQENSAEQQEAAQMIQRNYRGYRERRQLQGFGLDASARWAEVNPPSPPRIQNVTLTVT